MKKMLAGFVLFSLLFVTSAYAAKPVSKLKANGIRLVPGNQTITMNWASPGNSEGNKRTFIVHTPPKVDKKKVYPVVFIFHGGGGSGAKALEQYGFDKTADTQGVIVVYPTGTSSDPRHGYTWNNGLGFGLNLNAKADSVDDVGFVREIHKKLTTDLSGNIDKQRVYAAGVSNGGMFTNLLAAQTGDLFAAVCSIAGTTESWSLDSSKRRTLPTPKMPMNVLLVRGTQDSTIMYFGDRIEGMHRPGSPTHNGDTTSMLRYWAVANRCSLVPARENVENSRLSENRYVLTQTFLPSARSGASGEVTLMTIIGGTHSWGDPKIIAPGEFNNSLWKFFNKYKKTQPRSIRSSGGM
jgi:polyhydroxybutyrate depolymerase